jgi:hypothetical protein
MNNKAMINRVNENYCNIDPTLFIITAKEYLYKEMLIINFKQTFHYMIMEIINDEFFHSVKVKNINLFSTSDYQTLG